MLASGANCPLNAVIPKPPYMAYFSEVTFLSIVFVTVVVMVLGKIVMLGIVTLNPFAVMSYSLGLKNRYSLIGIGVLSRSLFTYIVSTTFFSTATTFVIVSVSCFTTTMESVICLVTSTTLSGRDKEAPSKTNNAVITAIYIMWNLIALVV